MTNIDVRPSRKEERLLVAACVAAMVTLVPVAGHQLGVLAHLPDPPGALFDSDRITSSKAAHPLGVPDSLPGLANYTTTLVLILLALREADRQAENGPAGLWLGRKLLADAVLASGSTLRSLVQFGKLCSWCTGTALATAVMAYAGRRYVARALAPLLKETASP